MILFLGFFLAAEIIQASEIKHIFHLPPPQDGFGPQQHAFEPDETKSALASLSWSC